MSDKTLPPGWATVEIQDIITPDGVFIDGDWVESKDQDPDGDVRLIQLADIGDGLFLDKSARFLTSASAAGLRCTFLKKGDVLIARMPDPLGRACIFPLEGEDRYVTVVDVCIIRTSADFASPEFLTSAINFLGTRKQIDDLQTGTTRKRISRGNLANVTIPLPPLPEQKRIVAKIEELFSELEAGEASLRKARRQLGVYRQSLLKQAFEGKLTQTWRTQNPDKLESRASLLARIQSERQSHHEQQIKEWEVAVKEWKSTENEEKRPPKPQKLISSNESISVFDSAPPESWTTLNLSQFVLELGQGWSPKCENHEAQNDEWSVIKTTAIQFGHFDPSANKVLPKHLPPRRWLGLRSGEILITRAGPRSRCGVVCRVRGDHPRLLLCDKAYRLVLSESATSSEFVERLLCSPLPMAAIEKLKTGISDSGVNITQTAFLQLALPIPPLPEQQEIVRVLDSQFEAIERNERELDAALQRSEALRQAILKKAFTGRLVPQSPADEPATQLLARLRAERESTPSSPTRRCASIP